MPKAAQTNKQEIIEDGKKVVFYKGKWRVSVLIR